MTIICSSDTLQSAAATDDYVSDEYVFRVRESHEAQEAMRRERAEMDNKSEATMPK